MHGIEMHYPIVEMPLRQHSCPCCLFFLSYLGYTYYSNAYFGQGFGPIFLDDLLCTGRETRIIDCPRSTTTGVGDVDFCRGHLDDAGLRCQESMWTLSLYVTNLITAVIKFVT